MPTAAKFIALFAFAAVLFFAAEAVKPQVPDRTQWGYFAVVCAGIGAVCGWVISGGRAGGGYVAGLGTGMRTAIQAVVWALLFFSVREMVFRSMRRMYDGVFDAIVGTFDILLENGAAVMTPEPLVAILGGGALAGLLVEWTGRQWR